MKGALFILCCVLMGTLASMALGGPEPTDLSLLRDEVTDLTRRVNTLERALTVTASPDLVDAESLLGAQPTLYWDGEAWRDLATHAGSGP